MDKQYDNEKTIIFNNLARAPQNTLCSFSVPENHHLSRKNSPKTIATTKYFRLVFAQIFTIYTKHAQYVGVVAPTYC